MVDEGSQHNVTTPMLFVGPAGPDREFYLQELVKSGFLPVVADDTADADAKLAVVQGIDLVVMELLPRPDLAWALAARLAPTMSVIILTALIRPDGANREASRRLGCAAFIAKPCSPRQLMEVVLRVRGGERGIEVTTYSA